MLSLSETQKHSWEIGDEETEYMVDLFLLEASSDLSQVPLPLEVYSLT